MGFSVLEKHIRDGFNVTFSRVRKSNQKVPQRAEALWTPGLRFKIPSVELLAKTQVMCYQENFIGNCRLVQYSSEYFEPVQKSNLTAQGFVGIYKKKSSDLGGQQVMCFIKRGSLVGSWF